MSSYQLQCNLAGNQRNMENMVRAVDPDALFPAEGETDFKIDLTLIPDEAGLTCRGKLSGRQQAEVTFNDREITDPRYGTTAYEQRKKEMVRQGVLTLLVQGGNPQLPWGILTGVRPSKIYHYLRDLGFTAAEVRSKLETQFLLIPEKAQLLTEVGERQRPFFQRVGTTISIYIGIPFCPTKCNYCSFASYPLITHAHLVEPFLAALAYEIDEIGAVLAQTGSSLATLYIGGGTPSILSASQLHSLLERIKQKLPLDRLLEYTLEAGRPDTLDREKLILMRAYGVSRISVNPQTVNPRTLQRIGREHSIAQFEATVRMVQDLKFPCLNMDMIVGLPGETEEDWDQTLQQLLAIQGENITLHTLAPKRAATWDFTRVKQEIAEERVASWLRVARAQLSANNYYPYYLYRQRRSVAGQENCGYTLPGWEGIYNIIMMEERSTVLGLGGGGMSKWFDPVQQWVSRTPNPKCPATYSGRIKELVAKKVSKLLTAVN